MRATKIIVAIFTTLIGISIILGGLAVAGIGVVFVSGLGILGNVAETVTDAFAQLGAMLLGFLGVVLIILGIVFLIPGVIWVVLGAKFFSRKPNKGIAVTLIVFYFLFEGVIGISFTNGTGSELYGGIGAAVFCAIMIALLILYLVLLNKSEKNGQGQQLQQQPVQQQQMQSPPRQQMNFDPNTGQPLTQDAQTPFPQEPPPKDQPSFF